MPKTSGSSVSSNRIFIAVGIIGIVAVIVIGATLWYLFGTNRLLYVAGTPPSNPTPSGGNSSASSVPAGGQQQAGSQTGAPVVNPTTGQTVGVKCPPDSCLNPVYGSGKCGSGTPDAGQQYNEQECFTYPATSSNLAACDQQRTTYYVICGQKQ